MNLAQLAYFCRLATLEHYTRAATELHVTQSALSHSISTLESELGCKLFRKEGRGVRLTEDGRIFQKYAQEGLASINRGVAELRTRQGELTGSVEVGAIATVRSGYLPAAMKAYREQHGSLIEFHVYQGETAPLVKKVEDGICDLTLAGPVHLPGVSCTTLFYQELAVAVHKDHPLARLERIGYQDLLPYEVVTYRRGIACGEVLETFLRNTAAPLGKLNLVRNYEDEVMLGSLAVYESSVALTMITSNLLPNPDMVIIPFDVEGAKSFYPVSLSYLEHAGRSAAAQSFIDFLLTFEAPPYTRPDYQG